MTKVNIIAGIIALISGAVCFTSWFMCADSAMMTSFVIFGLSALIANISFYS